MPRVYAIVGHANSRKSSVIRALSGVAQRGIFQVLTIGGEVDVFVSVRALQEQKEMPAAFIDCVKQGDCDTIVVPLRIDARTTRSAGLTYPSGGDYIEAFLSSGWTVAAIEVLGVAQLPWAIPQVCPTPTFTPHSDAQATNYTASQIRARWGWS